MNYWILTISEENFGISRQQHWTVQGFRTQQRRRVDRMQSGDRLLYYVTGLRVFALSATIIATAFEDRTPLWSSLRPEETFPYRVRIRPEMILQEHEYLDASQIAPRLEFLRRWPPERWPLAFMGELNLLPRRDYELIEGEMHRVRNNRPGGQSRRGRRDRASGPPQQWESREELRSAPADSG